MEKNDMRITGVVALILFVVLLTPVVGSAEYLQKQFIIGGYVGPHQTEEQYRLYKEAGFTTVLDFPWEGDKYQKTLELAEKVGGLNVIFSIDQQFLLYKPEPFVPQERIAKFIKEVRNNKVVLGYNLFDEPQEKHIALLVAAGKYIRSLEPDKLTWISFFLYNDKLARSMLEQFTPSVISSPEYPYCPKVDMFEELYQILETYRGIAIKFRTPLWLYVQSASWPWPQNHEGDRRLPKLSEIRMQVYSNLAYGAKGLWYYTYVTPRHAKGVTSVILDQYDRIKPEYSGIKTINAEVLALGPVLMTLNSVDVMHVKPNIKGVKPFIPNNIIANIEGENLLVGCFKDTSGGDYFMIVNKLTNSANNNIRIMFQAKVAGLSQIDRVKGRPVKHRISNGSTVVNLGPGDGMLFKVN
jgi:hypothetical protein